MEEETIKNNFYGDVKVGARNSRSDAERLQQIHDFAVENGALCGMEEKGIDPANIVVAFGNEVKALGDGKVGGYLVRHSGEGDPDLTADFFDAKTEIVAPDVLPVLYQHGFDARIGKRVLGKAKTGRDDIGLWIEAQLDLRDEYEKAVYALAEKGKLGWSSGALSHLVEREPAGKSTHIKTWFIGEASLTPTPAEPRNSVLPIKSLNTLQAAIADTSGEKEQGDNKSIAGNTAKEPTMNEEIKALSDEVKAALTGFEEKVKTVAKEAAKEAIAELPEVKTAMNVQVTDAPEDHPFKSIAENLLAIKADTLSHGNGTNEFPRLRALKAIGASEGIPADGGFLLEPTLVDEIIRPQHEDGPFSNDVRRLPVGANSNYGWLNAVDETSRATGSRWGGLRGYRLAEAQTKIASKPTFRRIQWELKKYAVVVVATDELLQDSRMFSEIVRQGCAEELNFMLNEDIYNGAGIAGPLGIMNSSALITVTRENANAITGADISKLYNRMDVRSRNTAKFYVGNDAAPQLDALFATGSTAVLFPYAGYQPNGVRTLYGRPIVVTEFNEALGTSGDIVFADMNQYLLWEKGGIQSATSIHVYFLTDETAFRFVMRVDGKPAVNTATTPYKGSATTSPFVALTTAS